MKPLMNPTFHRTVVTNRDDGTDTYDLYCLKYEGDKVTGYYKSKHFGFVYLEFDKKRIVSIKKIG